VPQRSSPAPASSTWETGRRRLSAGNSRSVARKPLQPQRPEQRSPRAQEQQQETPFMMSATKQPWQLVDAFFHEASLEIKPGWDGGPRTLEADVSGFA
jgi:hypothetical protein